MGTFVKKTRRKLFWSILYQIAVKPVNYTQRQQVAKYGAQYKHILCFSFQDLQSKISGRDFATF